MSPARTPNPDPNAEARQRRHATAKAKKLLREGMARLQAVLDDRLTIDETPLEASDATQHAADAMHAALHQLDAADSIGRPDATAPAGAPTRQQGQFLAYISAYIAANRAGVALATATQATWKWLLSSTDLDLPLLVVDEAHRLKNPSTQISKLFAQRTSGDDAGGFGGIFRRMLFLTATPFELGHSELIEVLSRMSAVRPLDPAPASPLKDRLDALKKKLTDAQATALTLDVAWGRLLRDDLATFDSWRPTAPAPANISPSAREACPRSTLQLAWDLP